MKFEKNLFANIIKGDTEKRTLVHSLDGEPDTELGYYINKGDRFFIKAEIDDYCLDIGICLESIDFGETTEEYVLDVSTGFNSSEELIDIIKDRVELKDELNKAYGLDNEPK